MSTLWAALRLQMTSQLVKPRSGENVPFMVVYHVTTKEASDWLPRPSAILSKFASEKEAKSVRKREILRMAEVKGTKTRRRRNELDQLNAGAVLDTDYSQVNRQARLTRRQRNEETRSPRKEENCHGGGRQVRTI